MLGVYTGWMTKVCVYGGEGVACCKVFDPFGALSFIRQMKGESHLFVVIVFETKGDNRIDNSTTNTAPMRAIPLVQHYWPL
jgi:hypothetical protein